MLEVKRLRQAREWNQTELAYHAGLAPSVISQIENGKRDPTARTLRKLAGALGVEVSDLFPKAQASLPLEPARRSEDGRPGPEAVRYTPFEGFGIALAAAWDAELKEWDEKIPDGEWADIWDFARLIQWSLDIADTKDVYEGAARRMKVPLRADTLRLLDETYQAAKDKVTRAFEPVKTLKEFQKIWEASDMDAVLSGARQR